MSIIYSALANRLGHHPVGARVLFYRACKKKKEERRSGQRLSVDRSNGGGGGGVGSHQTEFSRSPANPPRTPRLIEDPLPTPLCSLRKSSIHVYIYIYIYVYSVHVYTVRVSLGIILYACRTHTHTRTNNTPVYIKRIGNACNNVYTSVVYKNLRHTKTEGKRIPGRRRCAADVRTIIIILRIIIIIITIQVLGTRES